MLRGSRPHLPRKAQPVWGQTRRGLGSFTTGLGPVKVPDAGVSGKAGSEGERSWEPWPATPVYRGAPEGLICRGGLDPPLKRGSHDKPRNQPKRSGGGGRVRVLQQISV